MINFPAVRDLGRKRELEGRNIVEDFRFSAKKKKQDEETRVKVSIYLGNMHKKGRFDFDGKVRVIKGRRGMVRT